VRKSRVLIVEDYDDAREMYAEYLSCSGFEMHQAANGVDAIRQALEQPPDIVIMDLSLPQMDGWETVRRLKTYESTARIPIVALTGQIVAEGSRKARQSGFDGFLTKPCLPEDLAAEIRRLLILANHSKDPH
jgi:two-component system, cell cycle response regulator DivK